MLKFSSISAFNLGSGRKTNENTTWVKEQLGLYAISDGASGPFGKWAADSVCMKMEEIFSSHRSTIDKYNETQARDLRNQLFEIMDVAVEQVNQYLLAEIKKDPKKSGAAA
ncbi:MAG: hypothetical protein ABIQ95_05510, partial [Bdellovibrionia bacterium]